MQGVHAHIKIQEVSSLTVLESSLPVSIVRRHRGIISVERRKPTTSASSTCEEDNKIYFLNLDYKRIAKHKKKK